MSERAARPKLSERLKRLFPGRSTEEEKVPAVGAERLPHGIQLRRFAGPEAYVEQMEPLRIAHLTDLHVGRVTPMKVQKAATAITNAHKPDLVLITGDFVCHSQMYLQDLIEVLRSLEAPVIGVLGNHDHWSGGAQVANAIRQAGTLLLSNQHTTLTIRHQRIQVVGLDDAYTGHADRAKALKGLRRDLPTIALSHIAEEADGLWHHGVPFVLSGHTHAGQITLAKLHELTLGKVAGHKYVHGLYGSRKANQGPGGAVYVGAGIGAAVMPLRLGERGKREIALFELGVSPGAFDEHHGEQPALPGRKPSEKTLARRAARVARNRQKRGEE